MNKRTPKLRALVKLLNQALFAKNNGNLSYQEVEKLEEQFSKSRREFIINSSKAAALVGIASVIPISGFLADDRLKKDIAIIGGGIAGLYAAYCLQMNNITAKIYEADNRVGGRMMTARNIFGSGTWTELGGEFIDTAHHEIWRLIRHFGLETIDLWADPAEKDATREFTMAAFYVNGTRYSAADVFAELKEVCIKIAADKNACQDNPEVAAKMDRMNMEEYLNGLRCKPWLKEIIRAAYTGEYGTDTAEQSSLNLIYVITPAHGKLENLEFFGDSDERYKVKNGNQQIPDAVKEKVSDQIYLNHKLTKIENEGKRYKMHFANCTEVTADYVIMTLPFSVLRGIEMNIHEMPDDKLNCIKTLGYGQNSKVLMGFKKRVWRETDPKKLYAGYLYNPVVVNGWDNSHMQNNNAGKGGYSLLLGGKKSTDLAEKFKNQVLAHDLTDEDVKVFMDELEHVFPGMKENSMDKNKAMLWPNSPYAMGSYTCMKPGQSTTMTHDLIAKPVGNIFFAGEHTSEDHQGFMNGGAESGKMAAFEILDKIGLKKKRAINDDGKIEDVVAKPAAERVVH